MKKLLESIAQTTGGMYVMVHNMQDENCVAQSLLRKETK